MEGKKNMIDHPSHYQREGRKECIEEMLDIYTIEMVRAFCLLNVYKYRYRHSMKNGEEDLQKANWYWNKYLELGGTPEAENTFNFLRHGE
jgi:hypothetical protein